MQAEEAWQRGDVATEQEQEQAQDSCCVSIAAPMEKHAMQTDMGVVEAAADAEVATAQYLNHEWPGSLLGPLCSPPLMMHHGEPVGVRRSIGLCCHCSGRPDVVFVAEAARPRLLPRHAPPILPASARILV